MEQAGGRVTLPLLHPMMRALLFFIAFVAIGPSNGQSPVIGAGQFFAVGQHYLRDNYDPQPVLAAELAASGIAGYALDLSPLNSAVLYNTDSVVCMTAPGSYLYYTDYYDTANVMLQVHDEFGGITMFLFLTESDRVRHVGGGANGTSSMNETIFQQYPTNAFALVLQDGISHGFEHAEVIDGFWVDASGSDDHYVNGSLTMEADGYGSITMPDGALIENTLRLRSVMTYLDSNAVFGVTTHQDTLFTWYAEGLDGPLMTMARGHYALTSGYVSPLPLTVYRQEAPNSVHGPEAATFRPQVFPNPFTEEAMVDLGGFGPGAKHVTITDAQGRVVVQRSIADDRMILDANGFSPGLHVLRVSRTDGLTAMGRFVVQF